MLPTKAITGYLSSFSAALTSKTLVLSTMIVVMVMMNDFCFSLGGVSLTGFVIYRVIGVQLIGSVVSCFLVHKKLLVGALTPHKSEWHP